MIQSVDFNIGGSGNGILNQGLNEYKHVYKQETKAQPKQRDLSPIWGPNQNHLFQRENQLDDILNGGNSGRT